MNKISKDGHVSFDTDKHIYLCGGKKLLGVTSLISKFKNKFDADAIAEKYARKHGLNKEAILAEWELKGRLSRGAGTKIHSLLEHYFKTGEKLAAETKKEINALKFIDDYFETKRLVPVEIESIVYNDFIATQIDLIARNANNEYFIFDHKTNDKIETNGYGKTMLPPFDSYPDASFYHYSLQVCLCKLLCKDYHIKDLFIVHLSETDYAIIKAEDIPVPDFILNYSEI